ncbi:hypothetical protein [Ruminococcus sp.]|nr:hypothetical protein [Ruminococcus sp.]HNZ99975.1 hypothetical protein [Ruminococcus sp.]HOH87332.1 hypothetical protein [Ruminococcus sp.]
MAIRSNTSQTSSSLRSALPVSEVPRRKLLSAFRSSGAYAFAA